MGFNQVIPFNPSNGGNTPGLCLDNVCKGFGIADKYASAWEAWAHTQQHQDRNMPDGLDVPLFYAYTATIDGVTGNYGHINVRLANGTVWSDGNIYANIDAYLAYHLPQFVGWGESVNDFTIIQGETDMPDVMDTDDGIEAYRTALHREPESDAAAAHWNGQKWSDIANSDIRAGAEWQAQDSKLKDYDNQVTQVSTLSQQVADLTTKLQEATNEPIPPQAPAPSPVPAPLPEPTPVPSNPLPAPTPTPAPVTPSPSPSAAPTPVVVTSPKESAIDKLIQKVLTFVLELLSRL